MYCTFDRRCVRVIYFFVEVGSGLLYVWVLEGGMARGHVLKPVFQKDEVFTRIWLWVRKCQNQTGTFSGMRRPPCRAVYFEGVLNVTGLTASHVAKAKLRFQKVQSQVRLGDQGLPSGLYYGRVFERIQKESWIFHCCLMLGLGEM